MAKNKQSNLIASVKMLNIGFINKYIISSGIGGGLFIIRKLPITSLRNFSILPTNYFSILKIDEIDYSMRFLLSYRIL